MGLFLISLYERERAVDHDVDAQCLDFSDFTFYHTFFAIICPISMLHVCSFDSPAKVAIHNI